MYTQCKTEYKLGNLQFCLKLFLLVIFQIPFLFCRITRATAVQPYTQQQSTFWVQINKQQNHHCDDLVFVVDNQNKGVCNIS